MGWCRASEGGWVLGACFSYPYFRPHFHSHVISSREDKPQQNQFKQHGSFIVVTLGVFDRWWLFGSWHY